MGKVEQFIKEYTRNCSNEIIIPTQDGCSYTKGYTSWLTPDHARKVAEIAREETIKEVCEWIGKQKELLDDSFSDPNDFADILKQAMRDETKNL